MKILITGLSGSIGSELAAVLPESAALFSLGRTPLTGHRVTHIYADFSEEWEDSLLPEQVDIIIHLTQSANFRDFPAAASEVFAVNTVSTLKLAMYAHRAGARKFIFASSGGIYGVGTDAFTEAEPLPVFGRGFYLGTKICSEIILDNFKSYMDIHCLRIFFAYGPGQEQNMLLPRLIGRVRAQEPISLQGEKGLVINPIYVSDAAKAIAACLKLEGSADFNIAGSETLSLREIGDTIGDLIQTSPVYKIDTDQKTPRLLGDVTRMKEYLHNPQVSLKEGLATMI